MQHHKLQVQEVGVARHQVYPPYHRLLSGGASCLPQRDYDGRGQRTASPMLTAIMSGGVRDKKGWTSTI